MRDILNNNGEERAKYWLEDVYSNPMLLPDEIVKDELRDKIIQKQTVRNIILNSKLSNPEVKKLKAVEDLFSDLNIDVNENDYNQQKYYLKLLDMLIDCIVSLRYTKMKPKFLYPDIVSLNESLSAVFSNLSLTKDFDVFASKIQQIYTFSGETLPFEYIRDELQKCYDIYREQGFIDLSITGVFCNEVLNQHRNSFMKYEKEKILLELSKKLRISSRVEQSVLRGRKLNKISEAIKLRDFEKLGITYEDYVSLLEKVKQEITTNSDIKKQGITLNNQMLNALVRQFHKHGYLDSDLVEACIKVNNKEVTRYIASKFENVKLHFLANVHLYGDEAIVTEQDLIKSNGINYKDFVIADKNRLVENISDVLSSIDDDVILEQISENSRDIDEISPLILFLNLFDELDSSTFINILSDYERIKSRLFDDDKQFDDTSMETIWKRLDDIILLANAYGDADDITLAALGSDVVGEINQSFCNKYLGCYLEMLDRQTGSIPPISINKGGYYFESGRYSDPERLLIGKKPRDTSCIDLLHPGGVKTYNEVLLKYTGDVILVRNQNHNLVSRILMFRRGNVVQLVTAVNNTYPSAIYKEIADKIIQESIATNDNIDYVFVNKNSLSENNCNFRMVEDSRFVNKFPHADFDTTAFLASSKRMLAGEEDNLMPDFSAQIRGNYIKPRAKIQYDPSPESITRLKALSIVMERDEEKREERSRNYIPFYQQDYSRVVCGEDWYIAIKKDKTIEEVILPTKDTRKYEEIRVVKEGLGLIDPNDLENGEITNEDKRSY